MSPLHARSVLRIGCVTAGASASPPSFARHLQRSATITGDRASRMIIIRVMKIVRCSRAMGNGTTWRAARRGHSCASSPRQCRRHHRRRRHRPCHRHPSLQTHLGSCGSWWMVEPTASSALMERASRMELARTATTKLAPFAPLGLCTRQRRSLRLRLAATISRLVERDSAALQAR